MDPTTGALNGLPDGLGWRVLYGVAVVVVLGWSAG